MSAGAVIVWFRADLRLADNPAVSYAADSGRPVIPVFVWAPSEEERWAPGAASRVWLHDTLTALCRSLEGLNSQLILRQGPAARVLADLAVETGASEVVWNRRYAPAARVQARTVEEQLALLEVATQSFNGTLLFEPWDITTGQAKPYQKFTAFWKRCMQQDDPAMPVPAPKTLATPSRWPASCSVTDLGLLPPVAWHRKIQRRWTPGEKGAATRLGQFVESGLDAYDQGRDRPDRDGTSRLSPHLHFGEISPRQIWWAIQDRLVATGATADAERFLSELGWREFSYHLLYHFPDTIERPLRPKFEQFPWGDKADGLSAWQRGETGYPIVDAGMRQLWATGWMHNRVRMIVASFLTKDLLIPWQEGAAWFWDTLVDADLANNTQGWQWTAGCGADAAPYFRIFNPVLQGEKFDSDGIYVRTWVPELSPLPSRWIHRPWEAPAEVLRNVGIRLGKTYPAPILDHKQARQRALEAYAVITRG